MAREEALVTIGLEVHVQLKTATKAFCGCSTMFGAPPNAHTCPVCLGLPGALPVFNRQAFDLGVRAALGLHCQISPRIKFDRKNYFYPDVPKNYQISQYDLPLSRDGWVESESDGALQRIGITRAHLEEDAGKLLHEAVTDGSLIDFNRAGVPLLEIVSEPDMSSPEAAYDYLTTLKAILQYLDVSDCDMEKGSLRCDANISIRRSDDARLGTKVEVKNLNSFKAVRGALAYEAGRQQAMLARGERIVQETRLWDTTRDATESMRSKEDASDYRYFPEPDLVPFQVHAADVERIRRSLPELPRARAQRIAAQYGLSAYDSRVLTSDRVLADVFEATVAARANAKAAANWIMGETLSHLNAQQLAPSEAHIHPPHLAQLLELIDRGEISRPTAKEVFVMMLKTRQEPRAIVEAQGLRQVSATGALEAIVDTVMAEQTKSVADYHGGKTTALQYLVGQCMKATKGTANPMVVAQLLQQRLNAS